jgi:hypothetical protein
MYIVSMIGCTNQKKSPAKMDVSNMIGIWTDGQTENATFEIGKDSIYYIDSFQKYKYSISGDSITIKFDGFDNVSKIEKVDKDSLILNSEKQITKYWRFKN